MSTRFRLGDLGAIRSPRLTEAGPLLRSAQTAPAGAKAIVSRSARLLGLTALGLMALGCGDIASDVITRPLPTAPPTLAGANATLPVGCTNSADCTLGDFRLCHPERQVCVECVFDGHCTEGAESCSAILGECAVACGTSPDCPPDDPICDTVIGFCVECQSDLDCAIGERCRSSECSRG